MVNNVVGSSKETNNRHDVPSKKTEPKTQDRVKAEEFGDWMVAVRR